MNQKAIFEAIGVILKREFSAVDQRVSNLEVELTAVQKTQGPKGEDGKDGVSVVLLLLFDVLKLVEATLLPTRLKSQNSSVRSPKSQVL